MKTKIDTTIEHVIYSNPPVVDSRYYYRVRPHVETMDAGKDRDLNGLCPSGNNVVVRNMKWQNELWQLKEKTVNGIIKKCFYNVLSEKYLKYDNGQVLLTNNKADSADFYFEAVDGDTTNRCYIYTKIDDSNYFLYYNSGALSWKAFDSTDVNGYSWGFERLIKVTGLPVYKDDSYDSDDLDDYSLGYDYFSENSFSESGIQRVFRTDWLNCMRYIYRQVFGLDSDYPIEDKNIFYNLYGARYDMPQSTFDRSFHPGIDINFKEKVGMSKIEIKTPASNTPINLDIVPVYAPFDGKIINYEANNGAITIKDTRNNYIYTFMHLCLDYTRTSVSYLNDGITYEELENTEVKYYMSQFISWKNSGAALNEKPELIISKGCILGWRGNKNQGNLKMYPHLHIEVIEPAKDDAGNLEICLTPIYNASFVEMKDSIQPYDAFSSLMPEANPPTGGGGGGGGGSLTPPTTGEIFYDAIQDIEERYYNNNDETISFVDRLINSVLDEAEDHVNNEDVLNLIYGLTDISLRDRVEALHGGPDELGDELFAAFLLAEMYAEADAVE